MNQRRWILILPDRTERLATEALRTDVADYANLDTEFGTYELTLPRADGKQCHFEAQKSAGDRESMTRLCRY